MKAHAWTPITKTLPIKYCDRCGLIRLNNKETNKAAVKPCPGKED